MSISSKRFIGLSESLRWSSTCSDWSERNVVGYLTEETLLQDPRNTYPLNGIVTAGDGNGIVIRLGLQSHCSQHNNCGSLYAITLLGHCVLRHDLCVNCCWSRFGTSILEELAKKQLSVVVSIPVGEAWELFKQGRVDRHTLLSNRCKRCQVLLLPPW